MTLPLKLNRRHKVTLFITLVLAGIAALSDAKMMEVAGILLFGFAFAWAFGSDSRVVQWLFLSVGVLLACGTAGLAWYIHQKETNLYAQKVAAFEQRIPELAEKYPLHKQGQIILDKDLWDLEQEWEGAAPVKPSKPPQLQTPPLTLPGNFFDKPVNPSKPPQVQTDLDALAAKYGGVRRKPSKPPQDKWAKYWDAQGNPIQGSEQPQRPAVTR